MKTAIITGPARIEIREQSLPEPGRGEVRVRLQGCGLCGSNLPVWEGRPWFNYPQQAGAPGHEGWGVIDAVGPEVRGLSEGDRVAVLSYHAFGEYDLAAADAVVRLPPALQDRPFPGEALGCALNVIRRCAIEDGQFVAVVGVGFLGALLVRLAVLRGAQVIALSRRESALAIARSFGAVCTIPLDNESSPVAAVGALTDGKGCDCVIEATGHAAPLQLAAELTRERGRLVIAGYHQDGLRAVNMQLWNWRGFDVINAHERDPAIYRRGIAEAVDVVAAGQLVPDPLYTHRFPLEHIDEAFGCMQSRDRDFMKALLVYA